MNTQTIQSMSSSRNEHWVTPDYVLDRVRLVNLIALDPCSNIYSKTNPKKEVRPPQNGLTLDWTHEVFSLGGLVFVNPPYGKKVASWVEKCVFEAAKGAEIILLTGARTDTQWCQDWIFDTANSMCFWKSRIRFIDGTKPIAKPQPAFFPSLVSYWGPNVGKFEAAFKGAGYIVPR